jgi:hypothetical protein
VYIDPKKLEQLKNFIIGNIAKSFGIGFLISTTLQIKIAKFPHTKQTEQL